MKGGEKLKRKLSIALTLALIALLVFSSTALAWDVEDPCVAANEDFVACGGFDEGSLESTAGAQYWPPGVTVPNDGYNLYRDDATDTGNFDTAYVWTFTPDVVDLPMPAVSYGPYPDEDIAEYWIMLDESPDTWYWATEPRGYNLREDDNNYLRVVLPDAAENFLRRGTLRYGDINFSDGTWLIQIPATLQIWNANGAGGAAEKVIIDKSGLILSDIRLAGPGDIVITKI